MTPEALRATIQALGVSQERAAILCGVSMRQMQRWLKGEMQLHPSAQRIMLLLRDKPKDITKYLNEIGEL